MIFIILINFSFNEDLSIWNRSKSAHVAPKKEQIELIRQKNALDLLLYEYAQRIFARRLAQFGWKEAQLTINNNSTSF